MANTSIKQKILSLSPHIELLVRKIYWDNIRFFAGRSSGTKKKKKKPASAVDIDQVLDELARHRIGNGALLVVHSSYSELKKTGLSPQEVISKLRDLIGPTGTLAMPVIRRYPEDPSVTEILTKDMTSEEPTFDVQSSKVWTGALPKTLLSVPGAVASRHPINSMVAVGPMAREMMANNLVGEKPLPCGINSSWNFCAENNAFVVGLGIDLTHSLTMIHVAEDILDKDWPIDEWYRDRPFKIVDGDFSESVVVRQRHPKWGTYKFAERTLCNDLLRNNILSSGDAAGINVEVLKAGELIEFLASKNKSGYPYFWVKRKS